MKVSVALGLRLTSNAQLLIDATHYTNNMTGNALFAAADIVAQVTTTITATTNLRSAMNAPLSDSKTDNIRAAREALDRHVTILANKVQAIANSPAQVDDQRVGIVHSAGMKTKTQGVPGKRVFSATRGEIEGSIHLTATGGAKAHEWQYTTDVVNFTNRTSLNSTTKGSVNITGLKRGNKYAFFHKPVIAGTATDWEGPLLIMVL